MENFDYLSVDLHSFELVTYYCLMNGIMTMREIQEDLEYHEENENYEICQSLLNVIKKYESTNVPT